MSFPLVPSEKQLTANFGYYLEKIAQATEDGDTSHPLIEFVRSHVGHFHRCLIELPDWGAISFHHACQYLIFEADEGDPFKLLSPPLLPFLWKGMLHASPELEESVDGIDALSIIAEAKLPFEDYRWMVEEAESHASDWRYREAWLSLLGAQCKREEAMDDTAFVAYLSDPGSPFWAMLLECLALEGPCPQLPSAEAAELGMLRRTAVWTLGACIEHIASHAREALFARASSALLRALLVLPYQLGADAPALDRSFVEKAFVALTELWRVTIDRSAQWPTRESDCRGALAASLYYGLGLLPVGLSDAHTELAHIAAQVGPAPPAVQGAPFVIKEILDRLEPREQRAALCHAIEPALLRIAKERFLAPASQGADLSKHPPLSFVSNPWSADDALWNYFPAGGTHADQLLHLFAEAASQYGGPDDISEDALMCIGEALQDGLAERMHTSVAQILACCAAYSARPAVDPMKTSTALGLITDCVNVLQDVPIAQPVVQHCLQIVTKLARDADTPAQVLAQALPTLGDLSLRLDETHRAGVAATVQSLVPRLGAEGGEDIDLAFFEAASGILLSLERSLPDADLAARLLRHFAEALSRIAEAPGRGEEEERMCETAALPVLADLAHVGAGILRSVSPKDGIREALALVGPMAQRHKSIFPRLDRHLRRYLESSIKELEEARAES